MKNVAFWDIKTQFVPHRRHITSSSQSSASECYVRFEVFTAVTTRNAAFWDIKTYIYINGPCSVCELDDRCMGLDFWLRQVYFCLPDSLGSWWCIPIIQSKG
jgi:hypothetical protein